MKRLPVLFLALAATVFAASANPTHSVESDVNAVTVFLDRAMVQRAASIDLVAGETTLLFSELPANLRENSLQVSGQGSGGVTILDVQSRNIFLTAEPSPEIRELEEKLKELTHQKDRLADETAALEEEQGVLRDIVRASTTIPEEGSTRPTAQELRSVLAFSAEESRRIRQGLRDITDQIADLQLEISAAQQQLDEARGRLRGRRAVKEVEVRVVADTAGPATLNVSYTIPGANWTPTYRARLDSAIRRVALDYEAQVINRTGEAWNDVALTLSTARPSAGGSAPEAYPWIVEEMRPVPAPRHAAADEVQLSAFEVTAAEPSPPRAEGAAAMGYSQASVDTGLTSAAFAIAARATIPADGTNHRVSITTLDLPAGLRHDTTPKFNPAAFLTAKVTNDSEFPLLPGSLAAFVDGAFIAESFLASTMANEEFELALGVDDAVSVERTLVNRFVAKTGFTNSGHRVTYEVAIELTNNKSIPVTLEVSESLPVSRHEKITVKILQPNEREIGGPDDNTAFKRDENGILTWTGSLAPGATRNLTLEFSIEHPADMDVSGVE